MSVLPVFFVCPVIGGRTGMSVLQEQRTGLYPHCNKVGGCDCKRGCRIPASKAMWPLAATRSCHLARWESEKAYDAHRRGQGGRNLAATVAGWPLGAFTGQGGVGAVDIAELPGHVEHALAQGGLDEPAVGVGVD